jgi:hypothetical protein
LLAPFALCVEIRLPCPVAKPDPAAILWIQGGVPPVKNLRVLATLREDPVVSLSISPKKRLHVTALFPFVLPAKSLTINICNRVSPFSDLSINLPLKLSGNKASLA